MDLVTTSRSDRWGAGEMVGGLGENSAAVCLWGGGGEAGGGGGGYDGRSVPYALPSAGLIDM